MSLLRRFATGPGVTAVLTVFVIVSILWFRFGPATDLTSTGIPLLDSRTEYTPDQAYQQLSAYGEIGRRLYLLFLVGDFIWAAMFGATVAVLLLLALRRVGRDGSPWSWILLLPGAVVALDWIENALLLVMTARFPAPPGAIAGVTPLLTTGKLMLVNVVFLLALAAVLTILVTSAASIRRQAA